MRSTAWATVGRAATARRTNCKMMWGHLRSCDLRRAEQTHPVAPSPMFLWTNMWWLSSCGVACYAARDDWFGLQRPIWDQLKTRWVSPTYQGTLQSLLGTTDLERCPRHINGKVSVLRAQNLDLQMPVVWTFTQPCDAAIITNATL